MNIVEAVKSLEKALSSTSYERLPSILIHNEEDCEEFYISFIGRNKHLIDDLLDFREFKLKNSNSTIDDLYELCYNTNIKEAFEATFLQEITEEDETLIMNAINTGKITLEDFYSNFQKNINENILKTVL